MKHRMLLLCLLIAILFAIWGSSVAFAEGTPVFSLSNVTGERGEIVTVNISVTDNPGFSALKLKLKYDKAVLRLVSAEKSGIAHGMSFTGSNSKDENPYVMVWGSASNVSDEGVIAVISFEILNSAVDSYTMVDLECDFCSNEEGQNIGAKLISGKVTRNETAVAATPTAGIPTKDDNKNVSECEVTYWWLLVFIPIFIMAIVVITVVHKRRKMSS